MSENKQKSQFTGSISSESDEAGWLLNTDKTCIMKGHISETGYCAGILTISDKGAAGEREDTSGPLLNQMVEQAGYEVIRFQIVPDDEELIYKELTCMSDEMGADVIFTTGGTGLSAHDRTPEATMRASTRNVPGIAEAIREYSRSITPRAMFSRAVSVVRNRTLIINLPGSPKAVKEILEYLLSELSHGLDILTGSDGECGRNHETPNNSNEN